MLIKLFVFAKNVIYELYTNNIYKAIFNIYIKSEEAEQISTIIENIERCSFSSIKKFEKDFFLNIMLIFFTKFCTFLTAVLLLSLHS